MRVIMVSGSHPRHIHVIKAIAATGCLAGVVLMRSEKFNRDVPDKMDETLVGLYRHHFDLREKMEEKYFGSVDKGFLNSINHIYVEPHELNGPAVEEYLKSLACDLLISYGPNLIKENILSMVHNNALNLHGGLSPYYKGSATMFWPFYFLEPNYVGTTLHYIVPKIDAGRIVHQTVPSLMRGDCMHEVACKTIVKATEELKTIVTNMAQGAVYKGIPQKKNGKLFLVKDWRPEHLRLIYETYQDKIVDMYLDGVINQNNEPELIRAI